MFRYNSVSVELMFSLLYGDVLKYAVTVYEK